MFLFWFRFSKNWWVSSSRKCWRYNLNALKICCSSVQHMAKLCLNLLLVWFLSFSPCFGKNVEILVTGNFHICWYWFSIQIEYKLMAYIFMRWFWCYLFLAEVYKYFFQGDGRTVLQLYVSGYWAKK
jgi:hypothetical protein